MNSSRTGKHLRGPLGKSAFTADWISSMDENCALFGAAEGTEISLLGQHQDYRSDGAALVPGVWPGSRRHGVRCGKMRCRDEVSR